LPRDPSSRSTRATSSGDRPRASLARSPDARAGRPELAVDHDATGTDGSCALRVYCILKNQPPDADGMTRRLIEESVASVYGVKGRE
jgi:hypothetical protein